MHLNYFCGDSFAVCVTVAAIHDLLLHSILVP